MHKLARRLAIAALSGIFLGSLLAVPSFAETHAERVARKNAQNNAQAAPQVRSAADVRCAVPKAPVIQVLPKTADIRYDYSRTTEQLTSMGSNTVNPYAANLDTTTGGLRADAAKIASNIKMGTQTYPALNVGCIWYDSIIVNISLSPVIYIAREYQQEPCKSAIIEHEIRHVSVDRDVMNKYALEIGRAIQSSVNQAGALGPFNAQEMPRHQDRLIKHIQSAIDSQQLMLEKEMRTRQGQIDSIEEYQRVSNICKDVLRKARR